MSLVPHTVTALAKSDSEGTGGSNIIAGAVVTMTDSSGDAAVMYDNASGANGSTAKQTNSDGYVVVYVEPGTYTQSVNGTETSVVVSDYVGENATEQRDKLGLGSAATYDVGTDSGNLMEVGARGWGGYTPTLLSDFDEIFTTPLPSGFYRWGGSTLNTPDGLADGGHVEVKYRSSSAAAIFVIDTSGASATGYFSTTYLPSIQDWRYCYDSSNTNFNEFGGLAVGDEISLGLAVSSTVLRFPLYINSYSAPSSITMVGTFEIKDPLGGTVSSTNNINLIGISSGKVAWLEFTDSSAPFSPGGPYRLKSESAASKITVNF